MTARRIASSVACIVSIFLGQVTQTGISWGEFSGENDEAQATTLSNNAPQVVYERDVRPIFKANCFHCHGEEPELQGGLDLRLVRLMIEGGDSGSSVTAGASEESLLWQKIDSDEMPVGSHKLTAEQKATVRSWIDQGAALARPEPEDPNDARFTIEELEFWSFNPPTKPEVPEIDVPESLRAAKLGPIDLFLLEKLQQKGLSYSPEADKATLLRRLKLDLLGLPPTREEMEDFISDTSEDAFERRIDAYLESPHYGERWGRHWLDTAGFAESDGNTGVDLVREHAWRYRDYVIQSFNANKPYDQFLKEQLAGDEMVGETIDPNNPRHIELLTATGFLRMAPDVTQTNNTLVDRNQAVADSLKVVSSTFLGLTVGCAQCHDHRYDPISIDDYYQFRAIFDPAFPIHHWKQPNSRLVDLTKAEVNQQRDEIEKVAAEREKGIEQRRREAAQRILDLRIDEAPEEVRSALAEAIKLPADQQSDEQKQLLAAHPQVKSVDTIIGQFIEFDKVFQMKNYQQYVKEREELAAFRATKPLKHFAMAVQEDKSKLPESAVLFRGDPEQPTKKVKPAELFVLARQQSQVQDSAMDVLAASESEPSKQNHATERSTGAGALDLETNELAASTGRRLRYADWLTRPEHPTVARVAVNRIWQRHFGRGIVATPNDFGVAGQKPSHPELLDYLAIDFVEHGWDVKRLHKQILMSAAYRQSSKRTEQLHNADPDNELLGRFSLQRMDAETIRDAILFASGSLVNEVGGPSVPVTDNGEGMVTIGKRSQAEGLPAKMDDGGADKFRRSIYIQVRRSKPLSVLEAFDMPVMNPNCEVRRSTTVAPQALLFLNDATILQASEQMANTLLKNSTELEAQVQDLFMRLFGRLPSDDDLQDCLSFLKVQEENFASANADTTPEQATKRSLASLSQVLMASNRFLYIE